MTEQIFDDYGIVVIKKGEKFFVRYDSGTAVAEIKESEVSPAQAARLQISEQEAYRVLLEIEPE